MEFIYVMHKPTIMNRQTGTQTERERKTEGLKRDAASTALRVSHERQPQVLHFREKEAKVINMNRYYLNDLYERSSI